MFLKIWAFRNPRLIQVYFNRQLLVYACQDIYFNKVYCTSLGDHQHQLITQLAILQRPFPPAFCCSLENMVSSPFIFSSPFIYLGILLCFSPTEGTHISLAMSIVQSPAWSQTLSLGLFYLCLKFWSAIYSGLHPQPSDVLYELLNYK